MNLQHGCDSTGYSFPNQLIPRVLCPRWELQLMTVCINDWLIPSIKGVTDMLQSHYRHGWLYTAELLVNTSSCSELLGWQLWKVWSRPRRESLNGACCCRFPITYESLYKIAENFSCVSVVRAFGALVTYECQKSSGEPADECPQVNMCEAEGIHPKASLRTQEERRGKKMPLSYSCACRKSLK